MKKTMTILLSLVLLAFCNAQAEASEGYPAVKEGIDFGGVDVTIYDYWSGEGARAEHPTEEQALQYEYRDWINATYNVNLQQKQGGDWGSNATEMSNFNSTPDGSLRMYIIEPGSFASLFASGVVAPINDMYLNLSDKKWNSAEHEYLTMSGQLFGLVSGHSEPRGVLYFNKRVLSEAGIDWNTIYDMQEAGTWTWEAFEEMLNKITRDTDNDGVNDIYGILGSSDDMYVCATFANGGSFFDFDENGKLRPTMNSDATIEALTWGEEIQQKYWAPTPLNANWDWYKDSWKQGYCGFYMYQAYGGFNEKSEMSDMADEWGCVAFPVPNKGDAYITVVSDNITLIPSCYDEETVAKLAFLYDLWTNDTPGVETEGNWIGNKYNYTDERAVDETYAMLREPEHCRVNKALYLGTQNDVLGNSLLWQLGESTPAELIEAGMSRWQALCDEFNAANPYDRRDDEPGKPDDQRPDTSLIAFVNRNYSIILGREADPTGQTNWVNALTSGRITGAELMYGFLNSMEFKQKNLSDEDKVEIMYNAMLGRGSDPNGKSFWVDHLKNGMSINAIADGFVRSSEFIDLCGHYGISNGTYQLDEDRDKNFKVTAFVNNCYNEALDRGPDVDGMNNWCRALLNKQLTAEQVVHGFVDSEEMKSRNLSNEEYVSKMYALYLDREPDQSGFEFWVNKLNNGEGRDKIEQGFAQSVEFKEIVAGYGLNERK